MGKVCVFFGHRNAFLDQAQKERLKKAITDLIQNKGVDTFWVTGYGQFDNTAAQTVRKLKADFPHIQLELALAYLITDKEEMAYLKTLYDSFFYPEGMEFALPRYAIEKLNRWLVQNADFIVCYVFQKFDGAFRAVHYAKNQGKQVFSLC